jgi:hypothetical protein
VRRWNSLLILLSALAVAGSVWVFVTVDEDAVQAATGLADVLLGLLVGMLAFRGWLARRRRSATPEQRDKALRRLADEMRLRLRDDRRYPAFRAPEPLAMRWRVRPPVFPSPGSPPSANGQLNTGEGPDALLDWMSRVASRRAALIGLPGAGKTTLVALLARELLQHDRRDGPDLVPVIVSLADWDPRADSLERWISLRLLAQFPELKQRELYGRDAALSLVKHGQVFPILDGLDEIRVEFTHMAVEQVRNLPPTAPVIVACRSDTFEQLTSDGRLAPRMNTVELEPLAGADVVAFLEAAVEDKPSTERPRWQRLIARVRSEPGDALTIALDTPLIAWLLWAAYVRAGRDPSPLLDRQRMPSAAAIEQHLLRDFLPVTLGGRSPKDAARAERWLGFMARRAARREVRGITWWATPQMVPRGLRRAATVVAACAVMVPLGVTDEPSFVLLFGMLLGLLPRLEPASARYRVPITVRSWVTTRDRLRRSLGIGCAIAAVVLFEGLADSNEPAAGSVLLAVVLGGMYAGLSEAVQRGFAKSRETLRLPLRRLETADSPPPVIGATWDWSRAAIVVAISLVFAAIVALPEDDVLAGVASGGAVAAALSPFAWFGKPSLSAPFQRQREVFRANLRYSLCRGALFSLIVPAVMLSIYLADDVGSFSELDTSTSGFPASLALLLLLFALFALVFAGASTLIAPCGQYGISLILLAPTRRLPWRPTRFFEDMHELGVLRRSGMGYEFRHERLRDTLLGGESETPQRTKKKRAAGFDEQEETVIGA